MNLYEYADQVFDFAGGRLLLRGHNTSGKTKALELLLPFCLDGDISPAKLDPFASASKDMKWNLVGCIEADQRIGYVWLEFERLREGRRERLTAGIGMRANTSLQDVKRWYFVARDRTVGEDWSLLRGRDPLTKAELAATLGEAGEVLDGQRDYRARLNDLIFGFAGEEQYQTMLRLMRDLRRPHLSKTLDPNRVAEQLSVGLPEVDEALMRRLAGGLEQIETLERGLARLRDVRDRLRRFHQRTYSAYARAVVRERAEALRSAQTAVENAAEQHRAVEARLKSETERAERSSSEQEAIDANLERLDAEQRAIEVSETWSSVAEVEALREGARAQERVAKTARERADDAAADASIKEGDLITASAAAEQQREQADDDLAAVEETSAKAGIHDRVSLLATQLRDGALSIDAWSSLARDLSSDWRDVLHRHRELLGLSQAAEAQAQRAREGERDAAERLEQASERTAGREHELQEARESLSAEFANWLGELVELDLDDDAANAAVELMHEGRSPTPALDHDLERVRSLLADERSSLLAAQRAAEEDVAAAREEIERLRSSRHDGPSAPEWSRASRDGRAGAPLWRLVDFDDSLPAEEQAGLEAALEASGLLDAWVSPSGELLDAQLADVLLTAGKPAERRSLLEALTPIAGQPVSEDTVAGLLRSVGLGEREEGAWVAADGRFALGPLRGRGSKREAHHIGEAARATRRAAQIASLDAQIARLDAQIARSKSEISIVDRRREALRSELQALPDAKSISVALDALRLAHSLKEEASRVHERALATARAAAEEEIAADAARREHAVAHELPSALDVSKLSSMRDAVAKLDGLMTAASRAWRLADEAVLSAESAADRLSKASASAERLDERARDEEAEARRLSAEQAAREQALGSTGEQLRRRHAEVVDALKEARDARRHAAAAAEEARIACARLQSDVRTRKDEHERARSQREQASIAFRRLGQASILPLVLGEDSPADVDRSEDWTFTRTLEVVRALPRQLLSVSSGSGELAVNVQREVPLLDRELLEADMGAYASREEDGLLLVCVTEGGADQPLSDVLQTLSAEIADREQILTQEERRVFNDALVEEIADHLRLRMHEVRGRVAQMNAVLHRSPTAAGRTVELEWRAVEDEDGAQREALALLRRDVRHLSEEDRQTLVAFLRSKIHAARSQQPGEQRPLPMADMLMEAFDYRRWWSFVIFERSADGRARLTRQRHAIGSGGEQSVLIHLPLFAAAAALYGETDAPRLVMLDEALSGIDDQTRERVLAATVAFDLDIVMTSHELWGTYRSVPQLSIYQLHRENGTFGVHAIPFLWDGEVLHELEQSELLV